MKKIQSGQVEFTAIPEESREVGMVRASTGSKNYHIYSGPAGYGCTCPGFNYRKKCLHVAYWRLENEPTKTTDSLQALKDQLAGLGYRLEVVKDESKPELLRPVEKRYSLKDLTF